MRKIAYAAIGLAGILAFLIYAQGILIPFVYGVILWFLTRFFKNLIYKVKFFKHKLPHWLLNTFLFFIILTVLSLVTRLVSDNINAILADVSIYEANLNQVLGYLNQTFNIDLYEEVNGLMEEFDYAQLLSQLADAISAAVGDTIMVILYAAFILSEEVSISKKIKKLYKTPKEYERGSNILAKINNASSDYIRLKTYVSLLTGAVGYVFLLIMGVDAPFFWAFLMFALNYIPTVGSLIATVFPAVFSLFQFGQITPFIIILAGLGFIEWVIGNVLEPRLMGNSLNLSPLVTILALIIWGQIWGITGMLLSTPITVVMVIIFSQFESTRRVAIMLSQNGDIDDIYGHDPPPGG